MHASLLRQNSTPQLYFHWNPPVAFPHPTERVRVAVFGSFYGGFHVLEELLGPELNKLLAVVGVATDDPSKAFVHPDVRLWRYPHTRAEELIVPLLARANGLPLYDRSIRDCAFDEIFFEQWDPELCLMATFGQKIPSRIFSYPALGFFNFHHSDRPWPSYPGPDPIAAMLRDGKTDVVITMHVVTNVLDGGECIAQSRPIPIPPNANAAVVHRTTWPQMGAFIREQTRALVAKRLSERIQCNCSFSCGFCRLSLGVVGSPSGSQSTSLPNRASQSILLPSAMIYLDHNATTPMLPRVFEVMEPYFCHEWGNPSSSHRFGSKLRSIIQGAREQVALMIGARSEEVLFTSCATESNNSAIQAALKANPEKRHIITSQVEHSSILAHCRVLEREGYHITYLPVKPDGLLDVADLEAAISDATCVVSLMWANNETGVLFPVREIGGVCGAHGVPFHCDAVQAAGKVPIDVSGLPITYLSLTGHKFGGPKGIGALYIRQDAPFSPFLHGGNQESGRRGGTESVPLIVGLGEAADCARKNLSSYTAVVRPIRDEFERQILTKIPDTELNGSRDARVANTTNICFRGIESESLLILLEQSGICASMGAACLGNSDGPSHVIKAMKPEGLAARQSLRFSLGVESRQEELQVCLDTLIRAVAALGPRDFALPAG